MKMGAGKFGWVMLVVCSCVMRPVMAMADPLEAALAAMDASSAKFSGAQASFEWDSYQMIVHSTDKQYGTIWFKRDGGGSGGGTAMRADVSDAVGAKATQVVVYKEGKLFVYQPLIDDLKQIKAAQYESFLTLGFGGSGRELKKNWKIAYEGTEPMQGVTVTKLDLTPLVPSKTITHVIIWVDTARSVSMKQQIFFPGGDYRTAIYSGISLKSVDGSVFNTPGTKKTRLQVVQ